MQYHGLHNALLVSSWGIGQKDSETNIFSMAVSIVMSMIASFQPSIPEQTVLDAFCLLMRSIAGRIMYEIWKVSYSGMQYTFI